MPVALALPPPEPGFEIVVSSHGMSQGLSQTDGIQIIPRFFVQTGAARIGAQWKNIDSQSANGVAALFLKLSRKVGKYRLDAGVAYRIRTGAKASSDAQAWEFSGGCRREFGRLRLRISADYSPKEFGSGESLYIEMGPTFDVSKVTTVSANVGRRERDGSPDYTSLNAGISRVVRQKLSLDARYYNTNRNDLGARYRGRIVFSARLAL